MAIGELFVDITARTVDTAAFGLYVTAVDRADLLLASIHLSQHYDCLTICFLFSLEILSDQKLLLIIKALLRLSLSFLAGHMVSPHWLFLFCFSGNRNDAKCNTKGF